MGAAEQLGAVAALARDVHAADELARQLDRTRTSATGWAIDGALGWIADGLEHRRRTLDEEAASRLVNVSMRADVDPALDELLSAVRGDAGARRGGPDE